MLTFVDVIGSTSVLLALVAPFMAEKGYWQLASCKDGVTVCAWWIFCMKTWGNGRFHGSTDVWSVRTSRLYTQLLTSGWRCYSQNRTFQFAVADLIISKCAISNLNLWMPWGAYQNVPRALLKAPFPAAEEHIGRRSRHPEGNPSISGPFYCPLPGIYSHDLHMILTKKAEGHMDPPHDVFSSSSLSPGLRLWRGDGRNEGRIWRVSFRILPSPQWKTNFAWGAEQVHGVGNLKLSAILGHSAIYNLIKFVVTPFPKSKPFSAVPRAPRSFQPD